MAAETVATAERIVVFTGAGISTDSGIPDFRGPNGVWTKNPKAEKASNITNYLNEPDVREAAWQNRLTTPAWTAEPNSGHEALVELERQGRLHALVTQNIDGLHQKAGNDSDKVIEVHGTVWFTRCWECDDRRPMDQALERVRAGDPDPSCLECRGILKSDTISFGQALIPEVIDRMIRVPDVASIAAMSWLTDLTGRRFGPSTGTNIWGVAALATEMIESGVQGSLVTLACDLGERYTDTCYDSDWLDAQGLDPRPPRARLDAFLRTGRLDLPAGLDRVGSDG